MLPVSIDWGVMAPLVATSIPARIFIDWSVLTPVVDTFTSELGQHLASQRDSTVKQIRHLWYSVCEITGLKLVTVSKGQMWELTWCGMIMINVKMLSMLCHHNLHSPYFSGNNCFWLVFFIRPTGPVKRELLAAALLFPADFRWRDSRNPGNDN